MFGSLFETAKRNHFTSPFFNPGQCATTGNESSCQGPAYHGVHGTRRILAASTVQVEGGVVNVYHLFCGEILKQHAFRLLCLHVQDLLYCPHLH